MLDGLSGRLPVICYPVFELLWRAKSDRGMLSSSVVEALDVLEDFYLHLPSRFNVGTIDGFNFERMEETFCYGVVVAVAATAHAL